jgi:hypothetical protein
MSADPQGQPQVLSENSVDDVPMSGKQFLPRDSFADVNVFETSSSEARFTSISQYHDGMNLYAIQKNNPTGYVDPTGLDRYVVGGASSGNPVSHSTLSVDNWQWVDGAWKKVGTTTYELTVQGTCCSSSSENAGGSLANSFFAALSAIGPSFGYGTVSSSPGTPAGSTTIIPSTPAQDIALSAALDAEVGGRAIYHIWFNNCHEWVNRRKNLGL